VEPRQQATHSSEPSHSAKVAEARRLDDLLRGRLAGTLGRNGHQLARIDSRVLKESRFKPVILYELTFGESNGHARRETVIAKGYHRGASGRPTFEAMQALWQHGLGDGSDLTIAAPVAYFNDADILLQAEAPGPMLYDYIREPEAALEHSPRIGHWLAKLHNITGAGAPPVVPVVDPWLRIKPRIDELVATRPDFASRVERIGLAVERGLASNGHIVNVPLHGDFQPKNIILQPGRVVVIDFDHFTYGEGARDVAYFLVQNLTMSFSKNGAFSPVEGWNAGFLDGYVADRGRGGLYRLPLFAAMAFLHILHYKLCVLPVRDASFVPEWLDRCEQWLEEGAP
jgi:tRNA A-37 threonylcarbamoyl transferase component Bud32